MKNKKIVYWMDGEGDNIVVTPVETPPVTEGQNGEVVQPPVETIVAPQPVDVTALMKDLTSLKELLTNPTNIAIQPRTADPIVPVQTPVSSQLEISNFANIGLNADQERTIQAHLSSVSAKSDSRVAGLEAQIIQLKNELSVKQTDEQSIVTQVQQSYEGKIQTALSQINALESQVESMAEQLKIKDTLISERDNTEFLNSEIKNKPWVEELVKAQKIKTREQYMTLITPTLEAREKKIYETINKHNTYNNVFRNVNDTNTNKNTDTSKEGKSRVDAMSYINKYINQ